MKTGTDAADLGHNPTPTDIIGEATLTPTEAIPGHTTWRADASTGVLPNAHMPILIHIPLSMTPHTKDHLHIGALQLTVETTADHHLNQHTNQLRKPCINLHPIPEGHKVNCIT